MFKKIFSVIILSLIIATPVLASNIQDAFGGNLLNFSSRANYNTTNGVTLESYISLIILVVLSILGVLFLVLIVYAGTTWMLAGGNEEKVTKAKAIIRQCLIGLALTLGAYIMSYAILHYFVSSNGQIGPRGQ